MPEARFEDVIKVYPMALRKAIVEISDTFKHVVEEETIEVISCVPSSPVIVGAYAEDSQIYISFEGAVPEFVTIKISAIRSGRLDQRFRKYSEEEASKNIKFWDSWKNG
jgi:hypothetical protein